jgi:hypothetical protein
MLKVQYSDSYEKHKDAIKRYYEKNHSKCVAINVASKKRWRAYQSQAKILRNILIAFFEN